MRDEFKTLVPFSFTAIMLWASLLVGCSAPPAREGGFHSPNPASKLYAIIKAGQARDKSQIPDLIEQLNSDDIAVRMMAIIALREITGKDMGYRYYDSPFSRDTAIKKWVAEYASPSSIAPSDAPPSDFVTGKFSR